MPDFWHPPMPWRKWKDLKKSLFYAPLKRDRVENQLLQFASKSNAGTWCVLSVRNNLLYCKGAINKAKSLVAREAEIAPHKRAFWDNSRKKNSSAWGIDFRTTAPDHAVWFSAVYHFVSSIAGWKCRDHLRILEIHENFHDFFLEKRGFSSLDGRDQESPLDL